MQRPRPIGKAGSYVAITLLAALLAVPVTAREALQRPPVALSELPTEAQSVYALIYHGGPFRYDRDGVVFGNREHLLPAQQHGYYHEYTVRTPGATSRGARRIICGGAPRTPEICYYTDDHYRSFRRIEQ